MKLKGSKISQNLKTTFARENQTINNYSYAIQKKNSGYEISAIFEETANKEKEHKKRNKKLLRCFEDKGAFSNEGDIIQMCRNCCHKVLSIKASKLRYLYEHLQISLEEKLIIIN